MMSETSSSFEYFDSGGRLLLGQDPGGTDRVERVLADLWSQAKSEDPDCHSVYRLSLANFVVVGHHADQDDLGEFAAGFSAHHPSRVLLASVDPSATDLTASLSASCRKSPSGDGVICWEKITLSSPPDREAGLTSAVRSLLVGRVATIVALALPLTECRRLTDEIAGRADLLVTAIREFAGVEDLIYWDCRGELATRANWLDLTWESVRPIRRRLAGQYEDPSVRASFASASEIVCAAASEHVRLLIAGWLVSRLGWVVLGGNGDSGIRLRRGPDGDVVSLRFQANPHPYITLTGAGFEDMRIDLDSATEPEPSPVDWASSLWPERLVEGLHHDRTDPVFLTAIGAALNLSKVLQGIDQPPRVTVSRDATELALLAATRFVDLAQESVDRHGRFRVVLAGGQTPEALYRCLASKEFSGRIPWDKIDWFWGDERRVPHDHPDSNYRMARGALLDHVPVLPGNVHPIPAEPSTPEESAEEYEAEIQRVFGEGAEFPPRFDLILLGLGADGHTASLFPDTGLDDCEQRLVWGGYVARLDTNRVSLTPRLINSARNVMFLVSGQSKADALAQVLYPPWSGRLPAARVVLRDGTIEWLIDEDAADRITLPDST